MTDRNAKVKEARALLEEYVRAEDVIDGNQRWVARRAAEIRERDAETSALAARQREIAAELAPLFGDEPHLVNVHLRGQAYAVTREPRGDARLLVRPLRNVGSLIPDDARDVAPAVVRLPGRTATISNGRPVVRIGHDVTVIDQEVG